MTEIEFEDLFEQRLASLRLTSEAFFLDDIQSHDAQIAHVFANQSRDIVVPNQ